jgi:hypothetical protein
MTTTNTYGRQVVLPLTNKSGGSVAAGDVVIVDTTNNDAFTTTTSGAFVGMIGVAQETIASNAVGRVATSGYAALVNVNASVTRGNFGKTHTVVKQATDAGASRTTGTFCQFLTGGTTPDAILFGYPDSAAGGSGASTSEPYVTTAATGGLSADTVQPLLADFNASGATPISMSGAATGTGVSATASADTEGIVTFTNNSYQYWDVASAIGTGNFDVRVRILAMNLAAVPTASGSPILYLALTDSSRTQSTAACVNMVFGLANATGYTNVIMRTGINQAGVTGNQVNGLTLPFVLRVKRVSTTVTTYVSGDNGRMWATVGTNTNSLNIAKVGLWGYINGATDFQVLVEWVRSY